MKHTNWFLFKTRGESKQVSFSRDETMQIAKALKIDFNNEKYNFNEFYMGVNVELEHGTRFSNTNVTNNDPILTGMIALAHLQEIPDYYTRLKNLEDEAFAYWKNKK